MDKQAEAKQARVEVLRDLIVSLEHKCVIGKAIGSDELKRPIEELRAEREALRAELAKDPNADARAARQQARRDARRDAARKLTAKHTPDELTSMRADARKRMLAAKLEYDHLSAAVQVVESNQRLQKMLDAVTPEEREEFLASLPKQ
jgi:Mg/Co/Ni transporter MgtE